MLIEDLWELKYRALWKRLSLFDEDLHWIWRQEQGKVRHNIDGGMTVVLRSGETSCTFGSVNKAREFQFIEAFYLIDLGYR